MALAWRLLALIAIATYLEVALAPRVSLDRFRWNDGTGLTAVSVDPVLVLRGGLPSLKAELQIGASLPIGRIEMSAPVLGLAVVTDLNP